MVEKRHFLLRIEETGEGSLYSTLTEVACRVGLHPELIEKFMHLGLVELAGRAENGEILFDAGAVPLIRRILRLRNELGVNYAGIGVILELISRQEALESRIEELESRLAGR